MSTPPNKLDQSDSRAEEVYYTQELLTEIFAAPIAQAMQKSSEVYILTGKFDNLVSTMQTSIQALWDRAMYAGIADAEHEIDNPSKDSKISLSSNLNSIIEFAKDPQLARIDGELKDLQRYLSEAQQNWSAKDVVEIQRLIDLKIADRDQVRNPSNPTVARKIAEKIRLERELDAAKRQGDFDRVNQIRSRLYPNSTNAPTSKPSRVSQRNPEVRQNKKRVITTRDQIARETTSGRSSVRDSIIANNTRLRDLLSFDPRSDLTADPYARLFEGRGQTAKTKAEARLLAMNNLQVYATLNDRYPAISRNSIFAQDYLRNRNNTTATSLQQQYQDQIKTTVARYVKNDGARTVSESNTLKRIQRTYQDDKLNVQYRPFISNLQDKYEDSKFDRQGYERYLVGRLNELGIDPNAKTDNRLNKLVQEEERLSLLPNPTKKQQARMEELEGLIDSLSSRQDEKSPSRFLSALRKLRQEEDPQAKDRKYINPNARIKLSRLEKERLIKLGRYDDDKIYAKGLADQIRGQKDFSYKQILSYISDLKREGGRFDESLYQIASRTAATEVAAAYSIGRLQVYLERGVNYVQWIATMDTRTSVFCQSLHRKIFAVRDLIPAAMAKQTFPKTRKPEWDPVNQNIKNQMGINTWFCPAHPYCRSFFSPIYTDESKVGDKYPPKGFPPDADLNQYLLSDLIERKKLFRGLAPDQKDAYLQEIVDSQNRMREGRGAKLLRSMGNLQDIFNSGLSYLTRRLRQDKVADFTVDEIKKNDSRLTAALVGGAAVLGTGAMMYFFMKSNLASTLSQYLKNTALPAVGGLTQEAVSKMLKDLINSSKIADKMPDSVKNLFTDPTKGQPIDATLGEKVNLAVQNGDLVIELAASGQLDKVNELISGGITGVNRQGKINALTRSALNSAMATRRQLNDSALSILNQAFVNKGGAIDPTKITSIQEWAGVYRVGIAGKSGTLVGKKGFDAVMSNPAVRSELSRLQEQMDRIERGLEGVETIVDPNDEIGKAMLAKERAEQRAIRSMINSIQSKVANPEFVIRQTEAARFPDAPQVPDMLNSVIRAESDYRSVVDKLYASFQEALPSNVIRQGFIPENINSVQELREVQRLIRSSLKEVGNSFLDTKKRGKPPYTPATAARKRDVTISSELLDAAQRSENSAAQLNNQGFTYNSNVRDIDNFFKQRVNSEVQSLIELDKRISNRMKEISD